MPAASLRPGSMRVGHADVEDDVAGSGLSGGVADEDTALRFSLCRALVEEAAGGTRAAAKAAVDGEAGTEAGPGAGVTPLRSAKRCWAAERFTSVSLEQSGHCAEYLEGPVSRSLCEAQVKQSLCSQAMHKELSRGPAWHPAHISSPLELTALDIYAQGIRQENRHGHAPGWAPGPHIHMC